MPIACHPNRWWDWCMTEDEKKKKERKKERNRSDIYWRFVKVCGVLVVYNWEVSGHFGLLGSFG